MANRVAHHVLARPDLVVDQLHFTVDQLGLAVLVPLLLDLVRRVDHADRVANKPARLGILDWTRLKKRVCIVYKRVLYQMYSQFT